MQKEKRNVLKGKRDFLGGESGAGRRKKLQRYRRKKNAEGKTTLVVYLLFVLGFAGRACLRCRRTGCRWCVQLVNSLRH